MGNAYTFINDLIPFDINPPKDITPRTCGILGVRKNTAAKISLHHSVSLGEEQFGVMPGRGTTDAIFAAR